MKTLSASVLATLLAAACVCASAEPVLLRGGILQPGGKPGVVHQAAGASVAGRACFLVQFSGPVREDWKRAVEQKGIRLLDYIPENTFLAVLDPAQASSILEFDFVSWVGRLPRTHRIEPSLRSLDRERIRVVIRIADSADRPRVASRLRLYGAEIDSDEPARPLNLVTASIPRAAIEAVSAIEEVVWVEEFKSPGYANSVAVQIAGVPELRQRSGLFGAGQIIAFADSGLDTGVESTLSPDFSGRLIRAYALRRPGDWSDLHGHGTHVMGSAVGAGVLSGSNPGSHYYEGSFAGIAPEAGFIIQSIGGADEGISLPLNLAELFQPPYNDGARIHSDSWGTMSSGAYTIYSQQVDEFVWNHPDLVLVFPSGNSGRDVNADGVTDPGSVWAPGTAKNCITVGGTESVRSTGRITTYGASWSGDFPANPIRDDYISDNASGMIAWSSRGPCADGRIKPDICAPGTNIISNRSQAAAGSRWWAVYDLNYAYWGGTSMSVPLVSGAAALVREYYEREFGVEPSAALVKATLLNGATDIHPGQYSSPYPNEVPKRPNSVEGWGRLNVSACIDPPAPRVVEFVDEPVGLVTGESKQYTFNVLGGSIPLAVTLVWTDPPGSPLAQKQLVNNLNLKVIDPNQVLRRGNGTIDSTNNVEGVDISQPVPGQYTVIVEAANVPVGPQPFALVVSGNLPGSYVSGTVRTASGNPVPGVSVTLTGSNVTKTTTTGAAGIYTANVPPGQYTVVPARSGWSFNPPQAQVEVGEAGISAVDFVGSAPPGSVSGTITQAVGGITNYAVESKHPYSNRSDIVWTITGHPLASQIRVRFDHIEVEEDMDYVFVEDAEGVIYDSFTGEHSDVWSAWVPGNVLRVRLVSDEAIVGYGFQISGYETDLITQGGLEGVWVEALPSGGSAVTGSSGGYQIDSLEPVGYTIKPALDSYLFRPDAVPVNIPPGGAVTGLNFLAFPPGAVSGRVKTGDLTEVAHPVESPHPYPNNVRLEYTVEGPENASRIRVHFTQIGLEPMADCVFVTDADGNIVDVFDEPHYEDVWSSWIPGNTLKVVLVADYSVSDYGFQVDRYAAILDERGVEGVTISLAPDGGTAVTGPGGFYTVENVRAGRVTASALADFWLFEPAGIALNCAPGLTTEGIDFFGTLQEMPSIAYAKSLPDGREVRLTGCVVTAGTQEMNGFFYIQDPSRVSGIRVVSSQPVPEGRLVSVTGTLGTQGGERHITASHVIVGPVAQVPKPLGMNTAALGGGPLNEYTPGVAFGWGTHNIGLLVKVCGKVADVGPGYFVLDGGSVARPPGFEAFPVYAQVVLPPGVSAPAIGAVVAVTGISSCVEEGGHFVRAVRVRRSSDIAVVALP